MDYLVDLNAERTLNDFTCMFILLVGGGGMGMGGGLDFVVSFLFTSQ